MYIYVVSVLLALIPTNEGAILSGELKIGEDGGLQIQKLHNLLVTECPTYNYNYIPKLRLARQVEHLAIWEADKLVYRRMHEELMRCRKIKSTEKITTPGPTTVITTTPGPTTVIITTAGPTTVTTTTAGPTTVTTTTTKRTTIKKSPPTSPPTTRRPITTTQQTTVRKSPPTIPPTTRRPITTTQQRSLMPTECLSAINYTEWWRLDHNGTDYRPGGKYSYKGYGCDLHNSTEWFRFTGEAGNRMMDTCPQGYSCGSRHPMWTDYKMPAEVGVKVAIRAFSAETGNCKLGSMSLAVIKCSYDTDYDLVYKVLNSRGHANYRCMDAFCGML